MTRAERILTLAYKAHQRGETAIAARMATLAFDGSDSAELFENVATGETTSEIARAEKVLVAAEATAEGSIFTVEGRNQLLAIAEKAHKDGLPKVAQLIADVAK